MQLPQVILLAGGESTRFFPFSHKNCFQFLGKPLLYWHYEQFLRLGIKTVIVVVNQTSEEVIKSIVPPKKLNVTYVLQKGKGQGQAVAATEKCVNDGALCILNASDVYDDSIIRTLFKAYEKEPECMHLGAIKVSSYFPGGYIVFDEQGNVKGIVEKPGEGKEPSDTIRIVSDIFPKAKEFIALVKKTAKHEMNGYEEAITTSIEKGTVCKVSMTDVFWKPLKYPWDILTVMESSLDGIKKQLISPTVKIGKHVVIEGPVIIEDNVRINEFTKIVGPTYIGKGTIIGNNNIIRKSHIGSSVVTGFNTDITRSYIGNNTWFHSNYIGDSVIGNNVSLGSGTVCANLRLDESNISSTVKGERIDTKRSKLGAMVGDNVRVGVNASIMPGIKIGSGSFVGAGVILSEDLREDSYVHVSTSVVVSKNLKKPVSGRDDFRKAL